jgi:hypothetical protein
MNLREIAKVSLFFYSCAKITSSLWQQRRHQSRIALVLYPKGSAATLRAKPIRLFAFHNDRTGRVRYRAYMGCYQENIGFRTPRSMPRRLSARYYTSSEASGETNSVTINRCLMGQLVWSGILGQMG